MTLVSCIKDGLHILDEQGQTVRCPLPDAYAPRTTSFMNLDTSCQGNTAGRLRGQLHHEIGNGIMGSESEIQILVSNSAWPPVRGMCYFRVLLVSGPRVRVDDSSEFSAHTSLSLSVRELWLEKDEGVSGGISVCR